MKKRELMIILLFITLVHPISDAQNERDLSRLSVQVYQPLYEGLTQDAQKILETKMRQIITTYGLFDSDRLGRFVVTTKIDILSKDIVAGAPQRISQKVGITFFLGDIVENKVFETITITNIGIGTNTNKSFIAAINGINPKQHEFAIFMESGKKKILSFYEQNCDLILKEVQAMIGLNNFDEAIYHLMSIPNVCEECFARSRRLAVDTYREKMEYDGRYWLSIAQGAWAESPNKYGATSVIKILSNIHPMASCRTKVESLLQEITSKLKKDDDREWEFEMEQYKDKVAQEERDFEFAVKKYDDEQEKQREERKFQQEQYRESVSVQKMYIDACRDIEVEYAKNQPKNITNYNNIYTW